MKCGGAAKPKPAWWCAVAGGVGGTARRSVGGVCRGSVQRETGRVSGWVGGRGRREAGVKKAREGSKQEGRKRGRRQQQRQRGARGSGELSSRIRRWWRRPPPPPEPVEAESCSEHSRRRWWLPAHTGRPPPAGATLLITALKAGRSSTRFKKGMRLQQYSNGSSSAGKARSVTGICP